MIIYIDASALVKRYIAEAGSEEVKDLIAQAEVVGTGIISRAEVPAAISRAVRSNIITVTTGTSAIRSFEYDWENLVRLQIDNNIAAKAGAIAWKLGLRGYDAVHLASALFWGDMLGEQITLATFDKELWASAQKSELVPWPNL